MICFLKKHTSLFEESHCPVGLGDLTLALGCLFSSQIRQQEEEDKQAHIRSSVRAKHDSRRQTICTRDDL